MLHNVLIRYKFLFNGTLGFWKTKYVDTEIQKYISSRTTRNRTWRQGYTEPYSMNNWYILTN